MYAEIVRGSDGGGNAGVWGRGMCGWGEYMGGTRGSCFVSTADDVLEMSMVREERCRQSV